MSVRIREYRGVDKVQVAKLFEDFQDYIINLDPLKRTRRLGGWSKYYTNKCLREVRNKRGKIYVADDHRKIVGFIIGVIGERKGKELLHAIPSRWGRVTELYLDVAYCGLQLGSKLLNRMEGYFRDRDCDVVWIEVFVPNIVARNFYQKLGY